MAKEWATIRITPKTREIIKSLKRGGESYDETIRRVIVKYLAQDAIELVRE